MRKDSLGDRMKTYERVSQNYLIKRMPVILRLDGMHFHTFTKGMKRPIDYVLSSAMHSTMVGLCEKIQGCVLGFTQSDEITLLLKDWKTLETSAWFDYKIQKVVSAAASIATVEFNKAFRSATQMFYDCKDLTEEELAFYTKKFDKATFDCRALNLTKEEVCNNFIWRQQDTVRNSIQSLAQANFSAKELHGLNQLALKEKLLVEKGKDWEALPSVHKSGICCIKVDNQWALDYDTPIFQENRNYIEHLLD